MTARIPPVLRPEHPVAAVLCRAGRTSSGSTCAGRSTASRSPASPSAPATCTPVTCTSACAARTATARASRPRRRDGGAVAILTDDAGRRAGGRRGLPIVVVDVAARGARRASRRGSTAPPSDPPLLFGDHRAPTARPATSYLLEAILKQLGLVTGLSSTAERHIGDLTVVSRLTTPEASEMHALLARMRESEVRAVAVEVSAQALTRHRVDGIVFDVVGVHQPQPRPPRRLRRHGGVLPGEAAAVRAGSRARAASSRLDSPYGASASSRSRGSRSRPSHRRHAADRAAEWIVDILEETAAATPSSGSPGPRAAR